MRLRHTADGPQPKETLLPAKLVVTPARGGSRITLVGSTGKELLASGVFSEPRAKGATLRALRTILGADVAVEDRTLSPSGRRTAELRAAAKANGSRAIKSVGTAERRRKAPVRVGGPRPAVAAAAKAPTTAKSTVTAPAKPAKTAKTTSTATPRAAARSRRAAKR